VDRPTTDVNFPAALAKSQIKKLKFFLNTNIKFTLAFTYGDMTGEEPFKGESCDCYLPLRRRLTGPPLRDVL
jgi:hypothetical protein